QVFVLGGLDRFGGTVLDYRASYSRATFSVGKNFGAKFTGPSIPFSYNNTANDGDTPALTGVDATITNPANCKTIKKVGNSSTRDTDEEYAYAINALFPLRLLNDDDRVKIGAQARLRDKASTPSAFSSAITPLALANASGPAITDFYGRYSNGP